MDLIPSFSVDHRAIVPGIFISRVDHVGGGMVTLKMNGKREIVELKIDPEALDPEDVEDLEDMIKAAFSNALGQIDAEQAASVSSLTGGMGGSLGGLF